ncbi:MAG: lipoprotein signal peptidase [Deltaproteobacteria bacterium]|nr:lipoprotein signal peptidase [Deltaproteobacteria bacterium]
MKRFVWLFVGLTGAILVLDQVTKALVSAALRLHESRSIIPGFLSLTLVHNTGAAFGILAGESSPLRTAFFLVVSVVAMGVVLWLLLRLRPEQKVEAVALSLIFGGAVGNVIDRIRFGKVIDFIDVFYRSYHWPAFNVADAAISVGVFLLFWCLILGKDRLAD